MSVAEAGPATAGSPVDAAAPSLTPTLRQRARSGRAWLIAAAILFLAVIAGVLISGQASQQAQPLDPTSASPTGARALVQVLRQHGVELRTASTLGAARAAARGYSDDELTIVVYDPNGYLSEPRLDELADGFRVALVAPSPATADALRADGHDVAVISAASPLENEHIAEGSNAGRAIRLLGSTRALLWYTPSPADAGHPVASIADVTPPWVTPVIVLAAAVAAAAALWQGRRFGPLVVEDLPVVVRASESLEGRARLYQRADARLHALDALRMGAVGRLASALGLGAAAQLADVAAAVASVTGRPPAEVSATLVDGVPASDAEFAELARRLGELEASVGRAYGSARLP